MFDTFIFKIFLHEIDVLIFNYMNWYFDFYYMHVIDFNFNFILITWLFIFYFLFLHQVLVGIHICNVLAILKFLNRERWGYSIRAIRKLGLDWDSLEDDYHLFF